MIKSVFTAVSVAVLLANVGCGAAPDSSDSTSADETVAQPAAKKTGSTGATGSTTAAGSTGSTGTSGSSGSSGGTTATLSLADAETQIDAIRAKLDPTGDNALLFDATLTKPYIDAVTPIFAQVAKTDKIALGGTAFTYVSNAIIQDAIFDEGLFDDAVGSFADLWSFSFYWGSGADAAYWTKLNLVISHSPAAPLSDLQLLSLVANSKPADVFGALQAVHWDTARDANQADALTLPDDQVPYEVINDALFGAADGIPQDDLNTHDLDENNAFAVSVFTRSYSKLHFFSANGDDGTILVDLTGHLNAYENAYPGKKATNAITLVKTLLDAAEIKTLNLQLLP